LIRPIALAIIALRGSTALLGQAGGQAQHGQLDASPALFAVLAAINAAGYDADLNSTGNSPVRKAVRDAIASRKIESLDDLKRFFAQHRRRDWNAELNQYISWALSVDGPPSFRYRVPEAEIPPDAATLGGFDLVLQKFVREAGIEEMWRRVQPAFDQAIEKYHGPVSRALLEASGYLRNPTSGYLGRRFQIYVDLLGGPNQVQSRSYKDDYFIVVTPSEDLQTDGIRHAYLHYLLDPLALKYSESLLRRKPLADYAQGAPALEEGYKEDYILLATECFIKAVESRLAPSSQRQALVDQALKEGFVMTPAFAEGLAVFEKQPTAMRLYFVDLVEAIDLAKEEKRLANVQFVSARSVHMVKGSSPPPPPPLAGAEKSLAEAQELSAKRAAPAADLEKARELFLRSLQQTSNSTLHAKAYYGLARIAALQKNPESAERMFEKVLELTPDAETKCWTNVYLGLLAENKADPQERRDGMKRYQAALAVEGAPESARKAANDGLERLRKDK
jgi:tetratricopeptide (TPR) repeat protein